MQGIFNKKLLFLMVIIFVISIIVYVYLHFNKELFYDITSNTKVNNFFGKTFILPNSGYYYIKVNNTNNYLNFTSDTSTIQTLASNRIFTQNIAGILNLSIGISGDNNIFYIDEYGQILTNDKKII